MSTYNYYKVPFEGKIESVFKLFIDINWNISVKVKKNGIIYVKVPEDLNGELKYLQNLIFDKDTNSKFGIFEKITESEFEVIQDFEIPFKINESEEVKKLKEFKEMFCLSNHNFTDEKLLEKLKENNFNYKETFLSLIQ